MEPTLSLGAVFTLLVVTLGPVKILGTFAQETRDLDDATMRQIAVRAFLLSLVTVVLGSIAGVVMLSKWGISLPALELAGGGIFLLVGLRLVMEQYEPSAPHQSPLPAKPTAAALRLTFPTVVTPYGIAAVIVLLARSHDTARQVTILLILVGIMAMNLVTMLRTRQLAGSATLMVLRILGAVLGVLQVALAVEFILLGLHDAGILRG